VSSISHDRDRHDDKLHNRMFNVVIVLRMITILKMMHDDRDNRHHDGEDRYNNDVWTLISSQMLALAWDSFLWGTWLSSLGTDSLLGPGVFTSVEEMLGEPYCRWSHLR
jgi:hypothetical protein